MKRRYENQKSDLPSTEHDRNFLEHHTAPFIDCDSYIIYNIAEARWFPGEVQLMETLSTAKRYFQEHKIKLVDLREGRKWV